MLKRANDDQQQEDGPPAKQQAGGGGKGSVGMRADSVSNPIPRLFKQNHVTIHITQRTFEELGPGELKWIPTCQYWASMFDRFHANQFATYFKRCSTFQITDPKVRISNILMLQDEQTTESGTPKDVSVFTQACYLMHYQPKGIKNWFRLGNTDDCMKTQQYLTYQPMKATDCNKTISQLVDVVGYKDFEKLVINPSKADFYAGWHTGETMATTSDTTTLACNNLPAGSINLDEVKPQDNTDYFIAETFISPRAPYLQEFSCSVKGCEQHIPMSKHTTYARNLDKIMLHKYGDSIGFHINTNLDGITMLNHEANHPFGHIWDKSTKGGKPGDTKVYSVFCYPSDNRPFYSRGNNFDYNGPVNGNKDFGDLTHHFLTMPPIRKGDGTLIKQRCSFIMEQTVSVTFHFPETVTEDNAEYMLAQKNAVILRPAIVKIKKNASSSPKPPPTSIYDPVRDAIRDAIREITRIDFPGITNVNWVAGVGDVISTRMPKDNDVRWTLPAYISESCEKLGIPNACADLKAIITRAVGNQPTRIDFGGSIPIGFAPPAITETEMIAGKIIPKPPFKYTLRDRQLTDIEYDKMIAQGVGAREYACFGYLFWDFLFYYVKNKIHEEEHDQYEWAYPERIYEENDHQLTKDLARGLRPFTEEILAARFEEKCPKQRIVRIFPDRLQPFYIWNRAGDDSADDETHADFKHLLPSTTGYPLDFNVVDWVDYLWHMRLHPMAQFAKVRKFLDDYNACLETQWEELYPRIELTPEQIKILQDKGLLPKEISRVEDIDQIKDEHYQYKTSLFFV
nr:MAG: nonstructural protein [Densovirinae sp.]